jgi:hypothetical protein
VKTVHGGDETTRKELAMALTVLSCGDSKKDYERELLLTAVRDDEFSFSQFCAGKLC